MSKITPTSTRLVMKFKSRNPFVSLILVLMPPILPCLPCSNTTGKKKHAIRVTPQKRISDFQIHTIHTYLTKTITQWWFERFFNWLKKNKILNFYNIDFFSAQKIQLFHQWSLFRFLLFFKSNFCEFSLFCTVFENHPKYRIFGLSSVAFSTNCFV